MWVFVSRLLRSKEYLLLAIIILISVFFRFYLLEEKFPFGWDQERDAQEVWKIVKEGNLTLIGPSAAGFDTFYLGPLWYYLLVPFYFIFNMDPLGAAVFASLSGVITTVLIYFIFKHLFGVSQAIIGSLIWATLPNRTAWNPMLIPLLSVIIIFLLFKISKGNKKFIPWIFLVFGLSLQIHFQAIFYIPVILFSLFYFSKDKRIPLKEIIIGISLFLITLMPLVVFDIRHDYLNTKGLINLFFKGQDVQSNYNFLGNIHSSFTHLSRFINLNFLPNLSKNEIVIGFIIFSFSFVGIHTSKISKSLKTFLYLLILFPPITLSFYKGQLSEYYYAVTAVPILAGVSLFLAAVYKSLFAKAVVIFLVICLIIFQFNNLTSSNFYPDYKKSSLYYKKQAVSFIVNQKIDPIFNISYSTEINENTGFSYLFKFYGREPQDIPEGHLWTIVIPANSENIPPLATFGEIGIIRR